MPSKRHSPVRILLINEGDSLKTIYAKARKALTAEDIVSFTETEVGVPARRLLAEMEALDRKVPKKRQSKLKNGKVAHPPKTNKSDPKKKAKGRPKNGNK